MKKEILKESFLGVCILILFFLQGILVGISLNKQKEQNYLDEINCKNSTIIELIKEKVRLESIINNYTIEERRNCK